MLFVIIAIMNQLNPDMTLMTLKQAPPLVELPTQDTPLRAKPVGVNLPRSGWPGKTNLAALV